MTPLDHTKRSRPLSGESGFTLVELMIVVLVIGILAAIAIPNFISMRKRAQEAAVKANMHTVQLVLEDYSILKDGMYPTSAADPVFSGQTLSQLCPESHFPINPFTDLASVVNFNANPTAGNPGELAINPATALGYRLKGNGPDGDTLRLVMIPGQ